MFELFDTNTEEFKKLIVRKNWSPEQNWEYLLVFFLYVGITYYSNTTMEQSNYKNDILQLLWTEPTSITYEMDMHRTVQ